MPSFSRSRPAPRRASGPPKQIADTVTWTCIVEPRERYRILYVTATAPKPSAPSSSPRSATAWAGACTASWTGKFKTMRSDRVLQMLEQLTTGHLSSITATLTYGGTYGGRVTPFPVPELTVKVKAVAAHSTRAWTVNLEHYTCTCPEKRIRAAEGYKTPQLGYRPHIAKAILEHLPPDDTTFTPELRAFLSDPRKIHIDNLR